MDFDEHEHPRDGGGKFTNKGETAPTDKTSGELKAELVKELPDQQLKKVNNFSEDISDNDVSNNVYEYGSQEELDALLGEEFKGVKGQAAVDKLLKEKRGHVKGAFHRDDIGDIDLFWGNEFVGIKHIIMERNKEKDGHSEEVLSHLDIAVRNAEFRKKNNRGNFEFIYEEGKNKYFVIIAPEYHKNKLTYIVSTFRRSKK